MNGSIGGPIQGLRLPLGVHFADSRPVDYDDDRDTPNQNTQPGSEDQAPAEQNSPYGWDRYH